MLNASNNSPVDQTRVLVIDDDRKLCRLMIGDYLPPTWATT